MSDDASLSIEARIMIRRAAEETLTALDLVPGVMFLDAPSCLGLLNLYYAAKIPLNAECYDLSSFSIANLSVTQPDLIRLGEANGDQRILAIANGLLLYFPDTLGQAPVLYLASKAREVQENFYLSEIQADEWSKAIQYQEVFIRDNQLIYSHEEVLAQKKAELEGATPLPQLFNYLSQGIALAIHVAPTTFSYRFPEYAITQVAHWPIQELHETMEEVWERMTVNKEKGLEL